MQFIVVSYIVWFMFAFLFIVKLWTLNNFTFSNSQRVKHFDHLTMWTRKTLHHLQAKQRDSLTDLLDFDHFLIQHEHNLEDA